MTNGVEPAHPGQDQSEYAGEGDAEVDGPEDGSGIADTCGELGVLDRARNLCTQELHAAHTQQRQDGHRQDDDPHASQPIERVAPQIDGWRQVVKPGDDSGSGGGEPGHGFEKGICE